jgi:hypothetical protein
MLDISQRKFVVYRSTTIRRIVPTISIEITEKKTNKPCLLYTVYIKKLHGLSPRANYTDRATSSRRRS